MWGRRSLVGRTDDWCLRSGGAQCRVARLDEEFQIVELLGGEEEAGCQCAGDDHRQRAHGQERHYRRAHQMVNALQHAEGHSLYEKHLENRVAGEFAHEFASEIAAHHVERTRQIRYQRRGVDYRHRQCRPSEPDAEGYHPHRHYRLGELENADAFVPAHLFHRFGGHEVGHQHEVDDYLHRAEFEGQRGHFGEPQMKHIVELHEQRYGKHSVEHHRQHGRIEYQPLGRVDVVFGILFEYGGLEGARHREGHACHGSRDGRAHSDCGVYHHAESHVGHHREACPFHHARDGSERLPERKPHHRAEDAPLQPHGQTGLFPVKDAIDAVVDEGGHREAEHHHGVDDQVVAGCFDEGVEQPQTRECVDERHRRRDVEFFVGRQKGLVGALGQSDCHACYRKLVDNHGRSFAPFRDVEAVGEYPQAYRLAKHHERKPEQHEHHHAGVECGVDALRVAAPKLVGDEARARRRNPLDDKREDAYQAAGHGAESVVFHADRLHEDTHREDAHKHVDDGAGIQKQCVFRYF